MQDAPEPGSLPESPAVILDRRKLHANIAAMQQACAAREIELWPHVKTHKIPEIARWQLDAGATGITCAKLSEAEAMLPSGARRVFVANALVDSRLASRLRALADALDELRLAVFGIETARALEGILTEAGLFEVPVMLAVDTGLDREGVRSAREAEDAANFIENSPHMRLAGLYTHEGFVYGSAAPDVDEVADEVMWRLNAIRAVLGNELPASPGCSVTAMAMTRRDDVQSLRPGAYVFGDLLLSRVAGVMSDASVAAQVAVTVLDKPRKGLALIDAGSKVLALDRTPEGIHAQAADGRDLVVRRCSEEHGFLSGTDVDQLRVGERLLLTPAHICPVMNLASKVALFEDGCFARWLPVAARGCVA